MLSSSIWVRRVAVATERASKVRRISSTTWLGLVLVLAGDQENFGSPWPPAAAWFPAGERSYRPSAGADDKEVAVGFHQLLELGVAAEEAPAHGRIVGLVRSANRKRDSS